jgi:hypothetical protein
VCIPCPSESTMKLLVIVLLIWRAIPTVAIHSCCVDGVVTLQLLLQLVWPNVTRVAIFLCISIPSEINVPYFLHLQTSEWTRINVVMNIMFHKMWGIPWLASKEGLCSTESVSKPLNSISVVSWNLQSWSNIATLRMLHTFSCTGMVLHISHVY